MAQLRDLSAQVYHATRDRMAAVRKRELEALQNEKPKQKFEQKRGKVPIIHIKPHDRTVTEDVFRGVRGDFRSTPGYKGQFRKRFART